MKKLALLLVFTLLLGAFAACSGGSGGSTPSSPGEGSSQGGSTEPAGDGDASSSGEIDLLRIGVADNPNHMDPMRNVGNTGIRVHYNVFETLLLADQADNYRIKPMLASGWERIDDYTIEFTLNQGILFHNGDELTARDVQYSFDRLKRDDLPDVTLAASLMSVISQVEIVDDYTVRLITETIDPMLEDRVASSWGSWILPMNYLEEVGDEEFAAKPVGTGPYKVLSFSPEKIVLERFDDYWGELPAAKTVEYVVYPETSSRMTALITGEVDIITQLPPDQVATMESQPGLTVKSLNISNMHVLVYNTTAGPLADKQLRQAMNLAIDRQLLADTLWSGKAVVPRGHQYTEFDNYYIDDYPLPEYDPDRARELVEASSYDGTEFDYEIRNGYYTFGTEAAEAIIDMWKQVGINAKIAFTDNITYYSMANWSNTMRFPDPAGGLWLLWGEGSSAQNIYWTDMPARYLEAGRELTSIIDEDQRKALTRELMEIWDEEAAGTVLYYPFESWGVRDGIQWEPYSSQTIDLRAGNLKIAG